MNSKRQRWWNEFVPVAVTGLMLIAASVIAAPVNVVNPGFEEISGEDPYFEFTFGPLNGWSLYDPLNITSGGAGATYFIGTLTPFQPDPTGNPGVYANFPDGAVEGSRVAIAFNFFGSGNQGEYGYQQLLTETLQPNTRYDLKVEIGNIASATAMNGSHFDLDGLPGYRVDLLAGGAVVAQDNNSLFGLIDDGQFGTSTVSLTTGAAHPQLGQSLAIRLVNLNQVDPSFPDSDLEVDFDHVRLDATPIPDGDFNFDGSIDAADYVVWRRSNGMSDAYNVWQAHFGSFTGGGSQSRLSTVPEPHVMAMFIVVIMATTLSRCGRGIRRR